MAAQAVLQPDERCRCAEYRPLHRSAKQHNGIDGKMRGTISVSLETTQDEAMEAALSQESVKKFTEGVDNIKKIIYVPGKILNIVAPPAKK